VPPQSTGVLGKKRIRTLKKFEAAQRRKKLLKRDKNVTRLLDKVDDNGITPGLAMFNERESARRAKQQKLLLLGEIP